MKSTWIIKETNYDLEMFKKILKDLDLLKTFIKSKNIVVKPNLCGGSFVDPCGPVVTNRFIVRKTIEFLRSIATESRINVVESDSIGPGLAEDKFKKQNYRGLLKDINNVDIVDLSRAPVQLVKFNGRYFKNGLVLPKILLNADAIVSIAKIKTHTISVLSGATKNLFGCLPDSRKDLYHPYLTDVLWDLRRVLPVQLSLAEGCPAMQGAGPINGRALELGVIAVGSDPLIVDAAAAAIMGINPNQVPLLRLGQKILGEKLNGTKLHIKGEPLSDNTKVFEYISREQSFYVKTGLLIQKIGQKISDIGHIVHLIQGTAWASKRLANRARRLLGRYFLG